MERLPPLHMKTRAWRKCDPKNLFKSQFLPHVRSIRPWMLNRIVTPAQENI